MRALLSILCLFAGLSDDGFAEEIESRRQQRAEQYRAILAEIAVDPAFSGEQTPHDLADDVREALEAWTRKRG